MKKGTVYEGHPWTLAAFVCRIVRAGLQARLYDVRVPERAKLFIFAAAAVDIARLRALLPEAFVGRAYRIVPEVSS